MLFENIANESSAVVFGPDDSVEAILNNEDVYSILRNANIKINYINISIPFKDISLTRWFGDFIEDLSYYDLVYNYNNKEDTIEDLILFKKEVSDLIYNIRKYSNIDFENIVFLTDRDEQHILSNKVYGADVDTLKVFISDVRFYKDEIILRIGYGL